MHTLYFVRHGQTIWNVENKICGATDIALTDLGHQQAIETGKKILEEGIQDNKQNATRFISGDSQAHLGGDRNPGPDGTPADRAEFWKMGVHAPGRRGFPEGQGTVFKPLRGWRIHAPGSPADLQLAGRSEG